MAMQGKLVDRDGTLHVLYQTTFDAEPIRRSLYWKVLQTVGNPYGHERPTAGDSVSYSSSGRWAVTSRRAGGVSTGDGTTDAAFVEDAPVPPPPARGKPLRWYQGRWQRSTAKGWIDAGEGKQGRSHAARLDAEIAEVLSSRSHATKSAVSAAIDTTTTLDRKFQSRQRDGLTLAEKARQARGASARWLKRSAAHARVGEFREADDAETEAIALGQMATDLEAEASSLRTPRHAVKKGYR